MPKLLITGSLAYDDLYSFPGVFQDTLRHAKNNERISIAFSVKDKSVNFGGCAGNIVFNAKLLKQDFVLLGIGGKDFGEYGKWFKRNHIDTSHVIIDKNQYTSQASVVTDKKGQQITIFHEGAAGNARTHIQKIKKTIRLLAPSLQLAMVSPNNRDFMMTVIQTCQEVGIPYFFDPGQQMPVFSRLELKQIIRKAAGIILNDYELQVLLERLKIPFSKIRKLCGLVIVTLGERGSKIFWKNEEIKISAIKPKKIKDPTGCGDAYRAGFLAEITKKFPYFTKMDLYEAGLKGAKTATACLQVVGTQNHSSVAF